MGIPLSFQSSQKNLVDKIKLIKHITALDGKTYFGFGWRKIYYCLQINSKHTDIINNAIDLRELFLTLLTNHMFIFRFSIQLMVFSFY